METTTQTDLKKMRSKSKKSRKSSSHKKKKHKKKSVKRESVLKPSVYQKIQFQKRQSKVGSHKSVKSPSFHIAMSPKSDASDVTFNTAHTTNTNTTTYMQPRTSIAHSRSHSQKAKQHKRTVFISLRDFYECWRCIPSDIVFDCILLLPLYKEWIIPLSHTSPKSIQFEHTQFTDLLSDSQFVTLLQWKYKQGLAFFMLSHKNINIQLANALQNQHDCAINSIAPFWHTFSLKLQCLYDPDTCDSYRPLLLNERWWRYAYTNMYYSKYNVSANEILNELHFLTMKYKCIQEILFQSNPSLNVVTRYENALQTQAQNENINNSAQQMLLKSIRNILREPVISLSMSSLPSVTKEERKDIFGTDISIQCSNEEMPYLSCDTLPSPSESRHSINDNNSSASHICKYQSQIMNSGSDSDFENIKMSYGSNDKASSTEEESVSSSAMFGNMKMYTNNKSYASESERESNAYASELSSRHSRRKSQKIETLSDMEWWVCPEYYYDTYNNNCDSVLSV